MSTPKDREFNSTAYFESLPDSPDGTPRAAQPSTFPTELDKFPEHIDGVDEKVFVRYLHNLYVSIIQTQAVVGALSSAGMHIHQSWNTVYSGNDTIGPGTAFMEESSEVYLRGRKLIRGTHYTEDYAGGEVTLITAHADIGANNGDTIEITYTTVA